MFLAANFKLGWPSVLYILTAGDFVDRDGEGNVILDTRQLKTPLQFPMTMWKDPEAPHSVENLSKTAFDTGGDEEVTELLKITMALDIRSHSKSVV